MDIEKIIDFKFIPEEHIQQIFDLLLTDDRNNWDLIYQLFIGFAGDNTNTVINVAEFYFLRMMKLYRRECKIFNDNFKWRTAIEIEEFLNDRKIHGNIYGN